MDAMFTRAINNFCFSRYDSYGDDILYPYTCTTYNHGMYRFDLFDVKSRKLY